MNVSNQKILIAIIAITLILFPLVAFTSGVPRIVLGLCLVLFFPGYTLLSALFPQKGDLKGIERVALSFGLSIAVVPLIGLILNYTPWGIRVYPILISITIFILACSIIAWQRQRRLPDEERFKVPFNLKLPQWAGARALDKALSIGLIVAIVAALSCLGYVIATPKQGEEFTEFYILGPEGKAENYPKELMVGEEAKVILGIVNHEHQPTNYHVEIAINGTSNKEIHIGILALEEKWEQEVSFVPDEAGLNQKVEFWLYKDDETQPCLKEPLHLYIDVY
jgi:Predicted membrane protein